MTRDALDAAILAAHEAGDACLIAKCYGQAGNDAEALGKVDEACFFWVHAFVFALEAGADSDVFQQKLAAYGREVDPQN